MLEFLLTMLRFLYKMLRFLVKMLQHLLKIHSFSVEILALFSENAQNPRENAHIYSFIPSLSSSCSLSFFPFRWTTEYDNKRFQSFSGMSLKIIRNSTTICC